MTEEKPFSPNEEVIQDVIDGKYGHGFYQRKKLEKAGYDPDEVNARVFSTICNRSRKNNVRSYTETNHRMKTGRYEVIEDLGLYIFEKPTASSRAIPFHEISGTMADKVSKDGRLKNGASVMVVNILAESNRVWGKTSHGWICVKDNGRMLAKKI